MALKRIKPIMVRERPPNLPIRPDMEEVMKGRMRARRIAKGK